VFTCGVEYCVAEAAFSLDAFALLLEDDIEVAPSFLSYSLAGIAACYERDRRGTLVRRAECSRIVGISLYTPRVHELVHPKRRYNVSAELDSLGKADATTRIISSISLTNSNPKKKKKKKKGNSEHVYAHALPCSWGALYFGDAFRKFFDYLEFRLSTQRDNNTRVFVQEFDQHSAKRVVSRSTGWSASWKKYLIELMWMEGTFLLYPRFVDGAALSTNHLAQGAHIRANDTQHLASDYTIPLLTSAQYRAAADAKTIFPLAARGGALALERLVFFDVFGQPLGRRLSDVVVQSADSDDKGCTEQQIRARCSKFNHQVAEFVRTNRRVDKMTLIMQHFANPKRFGNATAPPYCKPF
jgi:hypothetical protein